MRKGLDYLIWLINSKCLLLFKCEAGIIWITLDSSAWRYHFWFVKLLLHNWWQFMKCSNVAAFLGTTVKDLPKRWFFFCQKLMLLMLSNISKIYSLWSLFSLNIATIAAFHLQSLIRLNTELFYLPKPALLFYNNKGLSRCAGLSMSLSLGDIFFNVIIYFKVI